VADQRCSEFFSHSVPDWQPEPGRGLSPSYQVAWHESDSYSSTGQSASAGSFGRLMRQGAPERMATDLKLFGDLDFGVIAGTQQCARLLQIAFVQRLGPAANSSPPASGLEPGVDPLVQYVALKFRQAGEDMKSE
jgi:hypothetical protein